MRVELDVGFVSLQIVVVLRINRVRFGRPIVIVMMTLVTAALGSFLLKLKMVAVVTSLFKLY